MRVRLGVLLAAFGGVLSVGVGEAAAALDFCERATNGRQCASLTVPLDRSGAVPGTVKLHIERQRAKRAARPPLFLIAGGPGQSATDAFDPDTVEGMFGTEVRSRDVVVMDLRGTGRSGALDCPALQRGSTKEADVVACAAELGPRRHFYSSADIAQDIDAVRAALGADRIAIYGISYGTYLAQVYARRHPTHIDRLVLDSVVGPAGVDAFERSSMAAVPRVVAGMCGKLLCRSFMRAPAVDAAHLAARLDRRPAAGLVTDPRGRRHRMTIDGRGLFDLVVASDRNPLVFGGQIPGAVHNALRGDAVPLLRAHNLVSGLEAPPNSRRELSAAAYVATLCADTTLPWSSATPIDGRPAAAAAFVAGLPSNAFAPFGTHTALASGVIDVCRAWPSPPSSLATPAIAALPDVPALLLAGGRDVRTPLEDARLVADQMPRAKVVSAARTGHGVLSWYLGGCPSRATRRFLAGGDPGRCGPGPLLTFPFPPPPIAMSDIPTRGGRPQRTAAAVLHTVFDASLALNGRLFKRFADFDPSWPVEKLLGGVRTGALRGGAYTMSLRKRSMGFHRAVVVPGVRVDGRLRLRERGFAGVLKVSGPAAAHGRVTLRRLTVRGRLGGRRVKATNGLIGLLDSQNGRASRVARAAGLAPPSPWSR